MDHGGGTIRIAVHSNCLKGRPTAGHRALGGRGWPGQKIDRSLATCAPARVLSVSGRSRLKVVRRPSQTPWQVLVAPLELVRDGADALGLPGDSRDLDRLDPAVDGSRKGDVAIVHADRNTVRDSASRSIGR